MPTLAIFKHALFVSLVSAVTIPSNSSATNTTTTASASSFTCTPTCSIGQPRGYVVNWVSVQSDTNRATLVTTIFKNGPNGTHITQRRTLPGGVKDFPTNSAGTRTTTVTAFDGSIDEVPYPWEWSDYDTILAFSAEVGIGHGYCTRFEEPRVTLPPHDSSSRWIDGYRNADPADPKGHGYTAVLVPYTRNLLATLDWEHIPGMSARCPPGARLTRPMIALSTAANFLPENQPFTPTDGPGDGAHDAFSPSSTPPPPPRPPPAPAPAASAPVPPVSAQASSQGDFPLPPPASSASEIAQIIASLIAGSILNSPAPSEPSPQNPPAPQPPTEPNHLIPLIPGVSLIPTTISQIQSFTDKNGHISLFTTTIPTSVLVGPGGLPIITPFASPASVKANPLPSPLNIASGSSAAGQSLIPSLLRTVVSTTLPNGGISVYTALVMTSGLAGPAGTAVEKYTGVSENAVATKIAETSAGADATIRPTQTLRNSITDVSGTAPLSKPSGSMGSISVGKRDFWIWIWGVVVGVVSVGIGVV